MKNYKLPKEFAEKWIEALRHTSEKFHVTKVYQIDKDYGICFCALGLGLNANDLYYIRTNEAPIEFNDLFNPITELNDDKKASFSEIADWIEQNVELY